MAKSILSETITFTPAAKTFNFNSVSGFNLKYLTAIVNNTTKEVIYMPAKGAGYGYTAFGSNILTVEYDTTAMNAGDVIAYHYDDEARQDADSNNLSSINTNIQDQALYLEALNLSIRQDSDPYVQSIAIGAKDKSSGDLQYGLESRPLSSQVVATDKGLIVNSVIHGKTTAGGGSFVDVKVTPSGALSTEATISGSLPLPADAATETKQDTQITHLNNIETATEATQAAVESLDAKVQAVKSIGNFYPNPLGTSNNYSSVGDETTISVDSQGNMLTRSSTDEGSCREPFDGSAIGFSVGTITLTNGADTITGSDLTVLERNSYIKLSADAESSWVQVLSIDTPTTGRLYSNYTGTGGTGAVIQSNYKPITGTGGSIGVASSLCTIGAGTTINQFTGISKEIDYGPLTQIVIASISQRIVNQNIYIGLQNDPTAPTKYARFNFSGATNTAAVFETTDIRSGTPSGADIETTSFTLPDGLTTASNLRYKIEITSEFARAYVNDKLVAQHFNNIPAHYNVMDMVCGIMNGGSSPASNTNLILDSYSVANYNSFKTSIASDVEKIVVNNAPPIVYGPTNVTANNTDFFVIDCSQFACVGLRISSVGGGATISWQASNDIAFGATIAVPAHPAAGGVSVTSSTAVNHFIIPKVARYLRVRTTAYTSGTITCDALGYHQAPLLNNTQVITTYSGTQAVSQSGTWSFTLSSPNTGNGVSTFHKLFSAATTNATSVKGSAGVIAGLYLYNANAAVRYFKLYNKASAPTVGSDTPVLVIPIPPNGTQKVDHAITSFGMRFSTGIAYAITGGLADADTTAIGANDVVVGINYA
jgi:hypothetical protein